MCEMSTFSAGNRIAAYGRRTPTEPRLGPSRRPAPMTCGGLNQNSSQYIPYRTLPGRPLNPLPASLASDARGHMTHSSRSIGAAAGLGVD